MDHKTQFHWIFIIHQIIISAITHLIKSHILIKLLLQIIIIMIGIIQMVVVDAEEEQATVVVGVRVTAVVGVRVPVAVVMIDLH